MAVDAQRELELKLKIEADVAAAKRAQDTIKKFYDTVAENIRQSKLDDLSKNVNKQIAETGRNNRIEALGAQYGKLARQVNDVDHATELLIKRLKEVGASEQEIDRATSAFVRAQQAADGSGGIGRGASGASRLTKFGRELKALPAVQIPGTSISTDAVGKITQLLGALPPVALGLSSAVVVAGVAVASLLDRANKLKEAAASELNARSEVIAFIQTATKEEIKAKLDEAKQKREINKAVFDDAASTLEQTRRQLEAEKGTFAKNVADAFSFAGDAGPTLQALKDNFNKAKTAMDESDTALVLLQQAYDANFAASTAYQEKLKEEAKIKTDATLAGAQDEYNRQLKLQQDSLLTSSQAMSKVTEAIQQQNAAQAALNKLQKDYTGGNVEIDKQITNYQVQIARLSSDIGRYYDIVAQKKPIEDAIQSEKDIAAARKEVDKVNDDVVKAQHKYSDDLTAIADKFRDSMANLKTAFDSANMEAEIDRQEKLADLAAQSNDKQVEAQEKYAEEREKIEEDYRKRVKEIERDFTRSSAQAIQDRDAVALDAAEQKRKDELQDARESRDGNLKEREKEYRAELRQLQKSNADRIAEINRDFQRQYEQRQRKYAADQAALLANANQERETRRAAYEKQLADLRTNLQQNTALWAEAGTAIVNYVKSVKDNINNLIGGGNSGVANGAVTGGTTSGSGNVFSGIFGFGAGNANSTSSTGLGVRSPRPVAAGGVNLAINGVGLGRNAVIREATKVLNDFYDGYERG